MVRLIRGLKIFFHQPLIRSTNILESKRHGSIVVYSMWHHEGCFLFIWLEHRDLVVLGECVYKGEHPMSGSEVNYLINLGQRKTILRASVVQIGVINTDSPFFTFL